MDDPLWSFSFNESLRIQKEKWKKNWWYSHHDYLGGGAGSNPIYRKLFQSRIHIKCRREIWDRKLTNFQLFFMLGAEKLITPKTRSIKQFIRQRRSLTHLCTTSSNKIQASSCMRCIKYSSNLSNGRLIIVGCQTVSKFTSRYIRVRVRKYKV